MTRVLVWNEYLIDADPDHPAAHIYPNGIHEAIAAPLRAAGHEVTTATLNQPEHGLTEAALAEADVLIWWGHKAHHEVSEEVTARVHQRVLDGMGFIALHSAHFAPPFLRLIGTSGRLAYRIAGELERVWVVQPNHPIAAGLGDHITIPQAEMYGEPFGIPQPDELVFISWFEGGDVFRSGACWYRENGRVFYFRPGHETYPIYHQPGVQQVLHNAVRWAAAGGQAQPLRVTKREQPLNSITQKTS